jgi:nicotinate-nucleotide adenylyltransferase
MTNQVRRLGILGGTFSPIHIGHMIMAENALGDLDLDEVLFMPAGRPPHKDAEEPVSPVHRIEMVEAAISGRPGFSCSRLDVDHGELSYTWRLLERITDRYPGADLWFIVGGDSLYDFRSWARPQRVLELARLAVIERPGFPVDESILESLPGMRERVDIVRAPLCDVSSTDLRERIESGRSIRYLVPEPVRIHIEKNGLYA